MLSIALLVLGLFCLIGSKADYPDLLTDCAYDCPLEQDACDSSSDCKKFESYLSQSNVVSSFNSSLSFIEFAASYCNGSYYTNSTYSVCDNTTVAYIECLAYSSCWISTTAYSNNCSVFATVTAEFLVISSSENAKTLCQQDWGSYLDNILGNSYVSVDISYGEYCGNYRRALLQTNANYSYYYYTIVTNGTSYFPNGSYVVNGTSYNLTGWALFEATIYFYSESSYDFWLSLVYGDAEFLDLYYDLAGYVPNSYLITECVSTSCCLNSSSCTNEYDFCGFGNSTSTNTTGTNTTGAGGYSNTPQPTPQPTLPTTAPTTFWHQFSPATSNKPLLVNFLILGVLICGWIW
jgi:hypothetical protein